MYFKKLRSIATLPISLLLSVTFYSTAIADVIAKAGTVELGTTDIKALVTALPDSARTTVSSDLGALEQVIRSELVRKAVLAEAKAKGFEKDPSAVSKLDQIREEALVRLWIANHAQVPASFPTEDDIKAAYEANKAALATPAEFRIAQIFISAPDGGDVAKLGAAIRKAGEVSAKLGSGDFAKLAREQSEHAASAQQGGDLGFMAENKLLPEVASVARNMKVGETAGPIKTAQGLHFIKLLEKKPSVTRGLPDVHDALATALRNRRKQELEQAYINELGSKLAITVNQIELAKLQPSLR